MSKLLLLTLASWFSFAANAATIAPCKKGGGGGKTITVGGSGGNFKTIQDALNSARPGDTVLVRAGQYKGGITIPHSGTAGNCITLKGEKGAEIRGSEIGIAISNKNYISITGFDFSGMRGGEMPTGISVRGRSSHIELRSNLVHNIENSKDAHGIAFYGTASTPMTDLLIESNEIKDCKLGSSESLVLNGNVTNFLITKNRIHDNDNIGIDIIGHEGKGPAGQDFARGGWIVGNTVYKISSEKNPAYKGEKAADGIYVDGGQGVTIDGNNVTDSDIGIELASEHEGESTSGIIVTNNIVSNSYQGNLMMGGFLITKGNASNISIEGNSFSNAGGIVKISNGPETPSGGEIVIQHNSNGITIKGNKFHARPDRKNIAVIGKNNDNISVDGNHYAGGRPSATSKDLASTDGNFQMLQEMPKQK